MIVDETFYDPASSIPIQILRNLSDDEFRKILRQGFLYLVPLNTLRLVTLVPIVDLASKLYREEKAPTAFNDMSLGIIRFDGERRFQASCVRFLYVSVSSTCTLFGLIWLVLTYNAAYGYKKNLCLGIGMFYYYLLLGFEDDILFHLLCGLKSTSDIGYTFVLEWYMEFGFCVYDFVSFVLCWICLGNAVKWVSFVVYYDNCIKIK